jgi:myo-inositol-1(or 4)-monophosphatase
MSDWGARADEAARVARDAGALALDFHRRRASLAIEQKSSPADFVTAADREVERSIRAALARSFPGEAFLGEESADGFSGRLDRAWVVDPIDGTHNFLRGMPYWTVAVAWVEEGRAMAAAICDPVHDEVFHGARGEGAFVTSPGGTARLRAADTRSLAGAYLVLGHHDRHPDARYLEIRRKLMNVGAAMRNFGSAALQLSHVAAGKLDAFVELELSAWDAVGGLLLVDEAGGYAAPFVPATAAGTAPCFACAPGLAASLRELTGLATGNS